MEVETISYTDDDRYGLAKPVYILDDLKVKAGCQAAMQQLMTDQYLPLARERKMELAGAWLFPPFERFNKPADIVYLWRFDSLEAWWAARIAEENDARLPAFWKRAEALLVSRTRRIGRSPPLMTGVEADQSCIRAIATPPAGARHIAVIKPSIELSADDQRRWVAAAEAMSDVDGVKHSHAGFHVEFSFLPGQMTWDVVAAPEKPMTPELLLGRLPGEAQMTEFVTLDEAIDLSVRHPVGPLAEKRTILLRMGDVSDAQRSVLEETLMEWTRQLDGLRTWSFARVLRSTGSVAWTHCWEQEFDDHRVVSADYLQHPYHWTVADRLFGPEGPEKVVYEFVHTMRACDRSLLTQMSDLELLDR